MQTRRNGKPPRINTENSTTSIAAHMSEYDSLRKTLISNMKRGSFTSDDLLGPARRMQKLLPQVFRSRSSQEVSAELFKMRAYISEIYYFFDLKREALQVLDDGHVGRLGLELFTGGKLKVTDCVLTREKIRVYLAYIQASQYGREDYQQAAAEFEKCVLLIKSKLMHDHNFQNNSTLALCYYNLGRALRQCSRHDEAMRAFSDALFYFHLRYQNRLKNYEQKEAALLRRRRRPNSELELLRERKKDETMMFHHRAGLVFGRGMAWSNYAQGQLLTALTENIVPARVFLDETKDEISKGYLNLIESTILRISQNGLVRRHELKI